MNESRRGFNLIGFYIPIALADQFRTRWGRNPSFQLGVSALEPHPTWGEFTWLVGVWPHWPINWFSRDRS
jgi:hypothetical protein